MAGTLKPVRAGRWRKFSKTSLFSKAPPAERTRMMRFERPRMRISGKPRYWPRKCTQSTGNLKDLSAPTNGDEKATFVSKSPHPSNLRQPSLNAPVVHSVCEQVFRLPTQYCTWVCAEVFH